tara:strand:+ start:277 stop:1413 length:1137 start_codon:yes stop_codon:yes gene_type:complete
MAEVTWNGKRMTVCKYFYHEFDNVPTNEKQKLRFFQQAKKNLTFSLNGNKAVYVDADSNLPLIGLNFLGIVDKGSEILEIKPITNCNASCSFCSVNEGADSNKEVDFVVDKDYLVTETKDLLAWKGSSNMQLWINPHGEPTLYAPLAEYCDEMLQDEHVSHIHIITNGLLVTKTVVDTLAALATKYNKEVALSLSLSGLAQPDIMGKGYNVKLVLRNLEYAVTKLPVTITPVFVMGLNDDELTALIELAKNMDKKSKHKVSIMIQKFCKNKYGRNPAKDESWEEFYAKLKELEEKTGEELTPTIGKLQETKELPCTIEKRQKVKTTIVSEGRYHKDKIGVVDLPEGRRAIALLNCPTQKGTVNATIVQAKHNMLVGIV